MDFSLVLGFQQKKYTEMTLHWTQIYAYFLLAPVL